MSARPLFSSRLTTILTMIGVAVGLGNVWRFPYMMGKYGGSAFLIVYLIFTFLFALPALIGEITLGRATRLGPIGAFRKALGPSRGGIIGYVLMTTILVASSYYTVVIANVIYVAYFSIAHGFAADHLDQYNQGLGDGHLQYLISAGVVLSAVYVIYRGLKNGIERVSKIFVPFFLVVIVYLIYRTLLLDGAWDYLRSFLRPDFRLLTPVNIFAALGQAVYSLSLGGTFMVVYGSYLEKQTSIVGVARWTAVGDIGAALLTSLFIVPAVLVYQLDMTSGPQLIFSTLPRLFGEMTSGQLIGSLFLTALASVAFLSLVAAIDVAYTCVREIGTVSLDKKKILMAIGMVELILIYPSAMDVDLIGLLDMIFGSGMQLIGSGLAVMAVTWGLGKALTLEQISDGANNRGYGFFYNWMKWAIPLILLLVLIGYIYSTISGL